jgi:hypothetical protein
MSIVSTLFIETMQTPAYNGTVGCESYAHGRSVLLIARESAPEGLAGCRRGRHDLSMMTIARDDGG